MVAPKETAGRETKEQGCADGFVKIFHDTESIQDFVPTGPLIPVEEKICAEN